MSDEWKTIRVPIDAYNDAKEDKDKHDRTWGEQLTATDSDNVDSTSDIDADEIAQVVVERLDGSKPLEDMAFDDWFEPDHAQTVALKIVDELENLDIDASNSASNASMNESKLAEYLADYLVNGSRLPEAVANEL